MSSKSILWLAVVVVVLGGVWYFLGRPSVPAQQMTAQENKQQTGSTQTQPVAQNGSQIQADSSLDADLSTIDSQAAAAGDASASANSSDAPVAQTE